MDLRGPVILVTETDRAGGAGGLAGSHHLALGDRTVLAFRRAARPADALDAIRAFLHDAARAHGDIRIVRSFNRFVAEIGIFLAVGIAEPIETAHFVGTIGLTEARADAAVVDLDIEPFAVVHGRGDRTDRLAGACSQCMQGTGWKPGGCPASVTKLSTRNQC